LALDEGGCPATKAKVKAQLSTTPWIRIYCLIKHHAMKYH